MSISITLLGQYSYILCLKGNTKEKVNNIHDTHNSGSVHTFLVQLLTCAKLLHIHSTAVLNDPAAFQAIMRYS